MISHRIVADRPPLAGLEDFETATLLAIMRLARNKADIVVAKRGVKSGTNGSGSGGDLKVDPARAGRSALTLRALDAGESGGTIGALLLLESVAHVPELLDRDDEFGEVVSNLSSSPLLV
jgi:hypothetical protein